MNKHAQLSFLFSGVRHLLSDLLFLGGGGLSVPSYENAPC